jgi:stage IV sporulation protein B
MREGRSTEQRCVLQNGRLGVTVRDSALGIGTVTYIDPETGAFGGLGHGITDSSSGELIPITGGDVTDVTLGGVTRGEVGKPGELCGVLTERDMGDLTVNSHCGVFGILTNPDALTGDSIPIGHRDEVKEGEATIISTLKNGKTAEYKIEIYDIDRDSDGSKSFRIRVTDETLKALTGGIVRGMSGSPIIQNGKLIGAVTHVLVADPTEGYGIFIENMLNEVKLTEQKNAA